VVSCERTVRAGGAGRYATMTEPEKGDQSEKIYGNRPRRISGRAQGTTRDGAGNGVLQITVENLECL